jgi:hypothetical protein
MAAATDDERRVTAMLDGLDDWRGATLRRLRELIHEADPDVVEEIKWVKPTNPSGVPTWVHGGILCTGEVYKAKVKLTFFAGAALTGRGTELFNSSLDGGTRRAIDLGPDDTVDEEAFKALVRSAVAHASGGRT